MKLHKGKRATNDLTRSFVSLSLPAFDAAGDLTLYILRSGCGSTFQMVFVCETPCPAVITRLFAAPDE
jgi:hypothetical protein